MSEVLLGKACIEALLPKGAIWTPAEGRGFDLLLAGLGDCIEDTIDYLAELANIRDPYKTAVLNDLLKEYAVTLPTLDEELQRKKIAARKYLKRRDGTIEQMKFFLNFNILWKAKTLIKPEKLQPDLRKHFIDLVSHRK